MQPEEMIKFIDNKLEIISEKNPSSVNVYHVKKNHKDYILKFSKIFHTWGLNHLDREVEILKKFDYLQTLTHLVNDYGIIDFSNLVSYKLPFLEDKDYQVRAILKEYYPGEIMFYHQYISDEKTQNEFRETVNIFHNNELVDLDIIRKNVVLNNNQSSAKFIDLGNCQYINEFHSKKNAEKIKANDIRNLEALFYE